MRPYWSATPELLGEHPDHVLHSDFVAADDHVVVLAVPDTLPALGQHGEVLVDDRGVDVVVHLAIDRTHVVISGRHAPHPAVAHRASGWLPSGQDVDDLHTNRAVRQDQIGIDPVDDAHVLVRVPGAGRVVSEIGDPVEGKADPVVLAVLVVHPGIGQSVLPNHALAVDKWEMVPLGERFEGSLPRHLRLELLLGVIAVRGVVHQLEFRTHGPEVAVDVDGGTGGQDGPNEAVALLVRQLNESVVGLVHRIETRLAGNGEKFAGVLVAPRVVRAGESRGVTSSTRGFRAAMAAVVEEHVTDTVAIAGHQ